MFATTIHNDFMGYFERHPYHFPSYLIVIFTWKWIIECCESNTYVLKLWCGYYYLEKTKDIYVAN